MFQGSIYQNSHLGWLDVWELYTADGSIWLDTFRRNHFLIGLQPSSPSIFWLHSFFAEKIPGEYPLTKKIRELLPSGRHPVYTISSHSWFNKFLGSNSFHKCDEIVEMETNGINIAAHCDFDSHFTLSEDLSISDIETCEAIFPLLWRLNGPETDRAYQTSSYKLGISSNGQMIGCLLADFAEDNCHIQRISVFPEYQNRGAASLMIRQMVTDAKRSGVRSFSVNTNLNNTNAVQFYEHLNFSIQGKRYPIYYRYI